MVEVIRKSGIALKIKETHSQALLEKFTGEFQFNFNGTFFYLEMMLLLSLASFNATLVNSKGLCKNIYALSLCRK